MWNDTNDAQQTLQRHLPSISQMIDHIVECMRKGGRLLYVGAGNSGRLAVVDAVECPPTFGCLPGQVQGEY